MRWPLWVALAFAFAVAAPAQQPHAAPDAWSPEAVEILAALRSGELERVRVLSLELAQRSSDSRVRRDAIALRAAALMRMSARGDRQEGRGLIAALAAESPEIITRPEILLAGGIAAAALAETAVSLEQLDAASRGFAALNQPERRREALVALAETWALHTEWDRTPPQFGITVPANEADKLSIRRKQMAAIADELDAQGDLERASRVKLACARLELRQGDAAAGATALQMLASAGPLDSTAAQAALALAEWHAAGERWVEAAAQYERVASGPFPDLADEARRRLAAVRDPVVEVIAPRRITRGENGTLRLRARNVALLSIEIRALDLGTWLESQQGRFVESKLPESGALLAAAEFETRAPHAHGWWVCSAEQADRLTATLPPSPVLILARWNDAGGEPRVVRRFAVVGGPSAGMAIGTEHASIWTADGTQPASARFWMFGSFVPTRVTLVTGAATFRLPPEARLLRDRRWSCLVEQGGRETLMTGELPDPARGDEPQALQAAVLTAPVSPAPGEELRIAGLLVSDRPHPVRVRVELRDALENPVADASASVQAEGLFETRIRMPDAAEGKTLRLVVRAGERLVESLMGPIMLRVGSAAGSPMQLRVVAPSQVAPEAPSFPLTVRAWYPWGTPAGGRHVLFSRQTVDFPHESRGFTSRARLSEHIDLDAHGQARLIFTPTMLRATPPAGVRFTFSADGEADWGTPESAVVLIARERPPPWVMAEPHEPRVGEKCALTLNLLRDAREYDRPASLVVRSPSGRALNLPLYITDRGWRASPWIPQETGAHRIAVSFRPGSTSSMTVETTVRVAAADSAPSYCEAPLEISAFCDGESVTPQVIVRSEGQETSETAAREATPVAILTSTTDVLGAVLLNAQEGRGAGARIDAPPDPCGLRVSVIRSCGDRLSVRGVAPVVARIDSNASAELMPFDDPVAPGAELNVTIQGRRSSQEGAEPVAMVRLVRLPDEEGIFSLGGEPRDVGALTPSVVRVFTPEGQSDAALGDLRLPAAVHDALMGPAYWLSTVRLDGNENLALRAPQRPGRYELQAVVRSPDGALHAVATPLRVAAALRATLSLPPRLLVGDRCLVSLALEHGGGAPLPLRVRMRLGEFLEAGELRIAGQSSMVSEEGWVASEAPAQGVLCLTMSAEAIREGAGSVVADVDIAGRTESYWVAVRVERSSSAEEPGPISVRRTLFRAIQEALSEPEAEAVGLSQTERWMLRRELVDLATVFQPGELVLVQEEVTLSAPLGESEWCQPHPAGFLPASDGGRPLSHTIGTERQRSGGVLSYATPPLPAGTHRHEYLLRAVWPGSFALPAPQVRTGAQQVGVRLEQEDTRLRIIAP